MHGHEAETSALVEADGVKIVVGGDDPEALTAMLACRVEHGREERAPDAFARGQSVEADQLGVVIIESVGRESNASAGFLSEKCRQPSGIMSASSAHEFCRSPPCLQQARDPFPVTVIGWSHQHRAVCASRPVHVGDLGTTADMAIRATMHEVLTLPGDVVTAPTVSDIAEIWSRPRAIRETTALAEGDRAP
jgi:hypothetical protein